MASAMAQDHPPRRGRSEALWQAPGALNGWPETAPPNVPTQSAVGGIRVRHGDGVGATNAERRST
jgi:hypothetical protein